MRRDHELLDRVIAACSSPQGVTWDEVVATSSCTRGQLYRYAAKGLVHAGGDFNHRRYFANNADLQAWLQQVPEERAARKAAEAEARRQYMSEWFKTRRKQKAAARPPKPQKPLKVSKRRPSAVELYRAQVLVLAARPDGMTRGDLPKMAANTFLRMIKAIPGLVQARDWRRLRVFASVQLADAWALRKAPQPKAERKQAAPKPKPEPKPKAKKQAFTVVTQTDRQRAVCYTAGASPKVDVKPYTPPHVKVQVCPSGRDMRFYVDPKIAGRGVITQDWYERRLQEQRA